MNKRLESILLKHQPAIHPLSAAMSDILRFYQLDYDPDICFGLGGGLDFRLPDENGCRDVPCCFNMDDFSYDLSYCVGVWCIQYRTPTAASFWAKLHDKWFEWIKVLQPLPILVTLPDLDHEKSFSGHTGHDIKPYLLLGINNESAQYSLLGVKGTLHHLSFKNAERIMQNEYYYAIFHPPLNFIADADKYMRFETSMHVALYRTIQRMLYGKSNEGIRGIEKLKTFIEDGNDEEALGHLTYLYQLCQCNEGNNGLYRAQFERFLTKAGKRTNMPSLVLYGEDYLRSSKMWTAVFDLYREMMSNKESCSKAFLRVKDLLRRIINTETETMLRIEASLENSFSISSANKQVEA